MLTNLRITNYALIRNLDLSFNSGLNTITGETGAGKSIMLGGLGLILGNRADKGALMDNEKKCIIEGTFSVKDYPLKEFFEENDLDFEDETIIRREITPSGKSRAFVNDTPVKLKVLEELGGQLVDIHSQHQTLRLNDPAFQMGVLDAFSGLTNEIRQYRKTYYQWREKCRKLEKLHGDTGSAEKEKEYFQFQLNEIEKLDTDPENFSALEKEFDLLENAEQIKSAIEKAVYELLDSETNITGRAGELTSELNEVSNHHQELGELAGRLEAAKIELEDVASELRGFSNNIEMDETRKEEVREKIDNINGLLRKHRLTDIHELNDFKEELQENIHNIENKSEEIEKLENEAKELEEDLRSRAKKMHEKRKECLPGLNEKVRQLLGGLGIPDATVQMELSFAKNLTPFGTDELNFNFSANEGAPLRPVQQSASGGELSRIMLSLKYLLANEYFLPTIIFDEIDSGISGEVAIKVGELINNLASEKQIICVTHQPQIAAMGDRHFSVYKKRGEGGTETRIAILEKAERVSEIAKMIGGDQPSKVAVENAKELVEKI